MKLLTFGFLFIVFCSCSYESGVEIMDEAEENFKIEDVDSLDRVIAQCCISKDGYNDLTVELFYYGSTNIVKERIYSITEGPIGYSDCYDSIGNLTHHNSYRYMEGFNYVINETIELTNEGSIDYENSMFVKNNSGDTLRITNNEINVNFDIYPKWNKDSVLVQAIFQNDTLKLKVDRLKGYQFNWQNENLSKGNLIFIFNLFQSRIDDSGEVKSGYNKIKKSIYLIG